MIRAFRMASRAGGQPPGTGRAWPGKVFLLLVLIATVVHWPRFFALAAIVTAVLVVPAVLVAGGGTARRKRQAQHDALDAVIRGSEQRP